MKADGTMETVVMFRVVVVALTLELMMFYEPFVEAVILMAVVVVAETCVSEWWRLLQWGPMCECANQKQRDLRHSETQEAKGDRVAHSVSHVLFTPFPILYESGSWSFFSCSRL